MNDNERIEELEPTEETKFSEESIEPTEDEMTDEEIQDEIEEDNEDTIKDEIEQPFYATVPEFDELREVLSELDYRLFLINDNLVVIGRLNGADIEILTNNRNEENPDYIFVKAPETLDKLIAIENVLYLSPDMTKEEKASYEGKEANHESVMEFLMNKLPETSKEELEDKEYEEIPTEIPEDDEEQFEDEEIEEEEE